MTDLATAPTAAADAALTWIELHGIAVERHDRSILDLDRVDSDRPVLHLLEPGVRAPDRWGELEDWVRLPADPHELYDRADRLLRRAEARNAARMEVDADDIFRVGPHLVTLSPMEAQIVRLLLAEERRVVARERIEDELWGSDGPPDHRALDNRVKRVRNRLAGLPVRIHTVRAKGYVLEPLAA